jgi:TonB family protein
MNPSVQHDDARFLDLLQRWQSGDFTRADEQELLALTDADDFRREAMEGFMALPEPDHQARLNALQNRLRNRATLPRRFRMPQLWAAAAALVLLIAAFWFVPQWNRDRQAPVAQNQPQETLPAPGPMPTQTAPETDGIAAVTEPSKPPAARTIPQGGAATSGPADLSEKESLSGNPAADDASFAAEENLQQAEYNIVPPQAPNAAPVIAKRSEGAMNKSFSKPEQTAPVSRMPPAADRVKAKKSMPPAGPPDSVWHKTDQKPDMDAERKAAAQEAEPLKSEPLGGWDVFREYLRQNARLPIEALNNNISGTVQVKFTINANGEPQNFVTLRSLGYGCDQEAVRLIKAWDWVRGQDAEITVDISFIR